MLRLVLGRLIDALGVLLVVLILIALVLLVAGAGTAGLLLVGRVVGGLFDVGTIETTAVALVVSVVLGLIVYRLVAGPSSDRGAQIVASDEDMVPMGDDEPERPDYDDEGLPRCPNCEQRLDLPPATRAERRRH